MFISKALITREALDLVKKGEEYDREEVATKVAKIFANRLYEELGGPKGMSLLDLEAVKGGLFMAMLSAIDWKRVNHKVNPEEFDDSLWRIDNDPEERL